MPPVSPAEVGLTPQQIELRTVVSDYSDRVLSQASFEYEERGEDPGFVYADLAELGLCGIPFDPAFGGGGDGYTTYLLVVEELARVWVAVAIGLGVHTLVCDGIQRFGDMDLAGRLLPEMLAGRKFGAYALTEPASGSDAAALRTRAVRQNGSYLLSGQKQFCTRGGEADHVLVMARTGGEGARGISAFIVDKGSDGFRPTRTENKMGWRASPTWELLFDSCSVPATNIVGSEGEGFTVAMAALDAGRLGIAACSIGLAQAALDASVKFASEREQFGRKIADFEGIQFMIADMATQISAGRALYRRAAAIRDAGAPFTTEAAMAKLFCSDVAMGVTTDAVQIHGGYGYVEEYPVERYMREAKALQIVEGTNQIQRMIIGKRLTGE